MPYHLDSYTAASSRSAQQLLSQAGQAVAPAPNQQSAVAKRNDKLFSTGDRLNSNSRQPLRSKPSYYNFESATSSSSSSAGSRQASSLSLRADELRLGSNSSKMSSQRGALFSKDYAPTSTHIMSEQQSPETSSYQNLGQQIPGSLQPGRPGMMSTNTVSSVAAKSQTTNRDHFSTPVKSAAPLLPQNFPRSSPAGLDTHGYGPFTPTTPTSNDHSSPTAHKYTPQNSQRNISSAPLGLSDIRPRAHSGVSEGLPGANPYSFDGKSGLPTNSNYLAPWALYAFDWCKWPAQGREAGKIAIGSYLEDGHNFIQILDSNIVPNSSESHTPGAPKYGLEFVKVAEATHSYPVTRLLWEPPSPQKQSTDLLATSGDHLRLWSLPSEAPTISQGNSITRSANHLQDKPASKLTPLALLSNSKTPEHTAPLTSLDWNTISPSLIITSSIDTTCTIWDIPTLTAKTQLIAHDKEVFDVRFCANTVDVFVSCGADGSVRMFDLRSLEHSTIIYEPTIKDDKDGSPGGGRMSPTLAQQTISYAPPLLRLAASPHDTHLLATFAQDSNIIRVLDVRQPGQALLELKGHAASVNCIEWSPSRRGTLASGADDSLVLVWDLLNQNTALPPTGPTSNGNSLSDNSRGPSASWQCEYEVSNISWAPQNSLQSDAGEWLGVSGGRGFWGVKLS
ncbi:hypothetical protein K3495_g10362 [Podosphaera aphanis]|nr:hypothetical protein K3495_g10362 [Podosphaera aphanis]